MADQNEVIFKLLQEKSKGRMLPGFFRGFDEPGGRMLVDFEEGRVPAYPATAWRPAVNAGVWVLVLDGVAWVVGPTVNPPADGVVVSTASGMATVDTDIGEVEATYPLGATLTAGQEVKLFWGGDDPHVIGVKSTSPAPKEAASAPGSGTKEYTRDFSAVDAGSHRSYWWQSQVWASDNNLGAWFYGNKIRDTVPSSAVIKQVQVFLVPTYSFGAAPNIGVHAHASKPGGAPTISSAVATSYSGAGWVDLPLSFGNALKGGGTALGVGTNHGGYHKFASLAQDGRSGALRIRYTA